MKSLSWLRICAAIAVVCLMALICAPSAVAQYTTVSASYVGGAGAPSGTIYWQPMSGVSSGPGAARIGSSGGQILGVPYRIPFTAGVFAKSMPDALATVPNICYAATAIDDMGDVLLGAGMQQDGVHVAPGGAYGCIQPTGSTWNFDMYVPGTIPTISASIGTVTALAPGSAPTVALRGSGPYLIDLGIPAGTAGAGTIPGLSSNGANGINVIGEEAVTGVQTGSSGVSYTPVLVAALPAPTLGATMMVSDGSSLTDCTIGGGTSQVLCGSDGVAWSALGGGVAVVVGTPIITQTQVLTGVWTASSTGSKICAIEVPPLLCNGGVGTAAVASTVQSYGLSSPTMGSTLTNSTAYFTLTTEAAGTSDVLWPSVIGSADNASVFKSESWFTMSDNSALYLGNVENDVYQSRVTDSRLAMFGWQCNRFDTGFWQYANESPGWHNTAIPCALTYGHNYHWILKVHDDPTGVANCSGVACEYFDSFQLDDLTAGTSIIYPLGFTLPTTSTTWASTVGAQWQFDAEHVPSSSPVTVGAYVESILTAYALSSTGALVTTAVGETTGDLGEYDFDSSFTGLTATGSPTVVSTNTFTAPGAALFTAASTYYTAAVTSTPTFYARAYVRLNAISTNSVQLMSLHNGGSELMNLYFDGSNQYLTLWNDVTASGTTCSTAAYPLGSYHDIELYWHASASAGAAVVTIDGAATGCSGTALNTGTVNVNSINFGQVGTGTPAWNIEIDNVGFSAVNWLGPVSFISTNGTYDLAGSAAGALAAANAAMVHKTGDETIGGNKTFTGNVAAGASVSFPSTNTSADTAALRAAIAASPTTQPGVNPFYLPPQMPSYWTDLNISDGQIAKITTPIPFNGQNSFNQVKVASGMDGFWIQPGTYSSNLGGDGYYYQNVSIRDQTLVEASAPGTYLPGGANVRYWYRFDSKNQGANLLSFTNNRLFGTQSGYALFANNATSGGLAPNQTATNYNGTLFESKIADNFMLSGIYMRYSGDENLFSHNEIVAPHGIYYSETPGANNTSFEYNTVLSGDCPLSYLGGDGAFVGWNELGVSRYFTQGCTTGTVTMGDGSAKVGNALLIGNTFGMNQLHTVPVPNLYIGDTSENVSYDWNMFEPPIGQPMTYNAGALTRPGKNNWTLGDVSPNVSRIQGPGSTAWDNNKSLEGTVAVGVLENRLRCSDDLTCSAWAPTSAGAGTDPVVSNVSGIARPEDPNNTGIVSCLGLHLNGGTTTGDESYIQQSISGLSNPHPTVGSVWLKSNVAVTGETCSGTSCTVTLATIAACGATTDGAVVGQPYTIANVSPSACNFTKATVTGTGTNTVTVASTNTCSYASGGNVVFTLTLLTSVNSGYQVVGYANPDYPDNGWIRPTVYNPVTNGTTTDALYLSINGTGSAYNDSDSVNLLFAGADNASGLWGHVTTQASGSQPLQYGAMGNALHGIVQSENGFQDKSTAKICDVDHVGTIYELTGSVPSKQATCVQATTSPATYALRPNTLMVTQQNLLLQSGDVTKSTTGTPNTSTPWLLSHNGTGSNPVCTAAPSINNPNGVSGLGDVQECVFTLAATGDSSQLLQTVTGFANPNTATASVWVLAKTGTPTMRLALLPTSTYNSVVTNTTTWQQLSYTPTNASTTDQYDLFGYTASGALTIDVYVAQPQIAIGGWSYAATTTTAIDTTAAGGLIPTANMCSGTIPGAGYYCDGNTQTWTLLSTGPVTTGANTFTGTQTAPAFWLQSKAAGPYSQFFDDFYTVSNTTFSSIGSPTGQGCNGGAGTYQDQNHPGTIILTSGTAGTGTGVACNIGNAAQEVTTAGSSLPWTWESEVYVPVLPGTTVGAYQAGITHTLAANPWTNGIGFYLSSANGTVNDWYCEYASTLTDSSVAATVAWTRLTMANDGTKVHWYINGTEACGTGVAIASMPSLTQQVGAWTSTALSATSVLLSVDYVDFQRAVVR